LLRRQHGECGKEEPLLVRQQGDGLGFGRRVGDRVEGLEGFVDARGAVAVGDDIVGDGEQSGPEQPATIARQGGEGALEDQAGGIFGHLPAPEPAIAIVVDRVKIPVIEGSEGPRIGDRAGDERGIVGRVCPAIAWSSR
jgi:hypothetical protein